MANIKIETLTPVHVGSGNLLYNDADFINETIDNKPSICIISQTKIWNILGQQHLDNWLSAIEKRDTKAFLKQFAPDAKASDYAERVIPLYIQKPLGRDDTLKECIHNGFGLPYIPGSSIKGAIRTAVLASLADTVQYKERKIQQFKHGRTAITASDVEKALFGRDPNSDVFRFIQVGDAYFERDTEIASRMINLNIRQSSSDLKDARMPQLVEAICSDASGEFQLKIAKEYYDFAKPKFAELGNLPVANLNDLFSMINAHTKKLVEDEIDDWQQIDKTGGDDYVGEMENVLAAVNGCSPGKSCVLRIGHASGWRFITGAWAEALQNFNNVVVPAARPNNRQYEDYPFPKTRRLDEDSFIFGFVKLTVN